MILNAVLLWVATFIPGLVVIFSPQKKQFQFKALLIFSGAYLFSVTVLHVLPELFASEGGDHHEHHGAMFAGAFLLLGFFLQLILEYFSTGVEHGHVHVHGDAHPLAWSLIAALTLHALLDGCFLTHPTHAHGDEASGGLTLGLVLHKIPEAIALTAVVLHSGASRLKAILTLSVFSLISPLGLVFSSWLFEQSFLNELIIDGLFALVAGNFLYISTTILFEFNPDHKFKANKLLISILGALTAFIIELWIH